MQTLDVAATSSRAGNPRSRIHTATRIVTEAIDMAALERLVARPKNGAVLTFVGQVRNHSRGRRVAYLEYDAYVPMAEKLLRRIAADAAERWGASIVIQHRIGRMEIGDASVVICVGSPHRAEAFEACRWCIDTLKETVPIWKKEVCPNGAFWIEGEAAVKAAPHAAKAVRGRGRARQT